MLSMAGHGMLEKPEAEQVLPRALKALSRRPHDPEALVTAAHCYNVLEQDEHALEFYEKAAAIPHPSVWINYAAILRQCGRHEEAFGWIEKAHNAWPWDQKAGHIYAEELIRKGRWIEAWPLCSRYRWSKNNIRPEGIDEWEGQDIQGKRLAVLAEGGMGDAFWLFRFLPKLRKETGAIISFLAQEAVARFLEGHSYLGKPNDSEIEQYDYWVSIFELLEWLRVKEPYWPGPYLEDGFGESGHIMFNVVKASGRRKRIGLCWDCGEAVDVRKYRSLKTEQAMRLVSNRSVSWISLQKDKKLFGENVFSPDLKTWKDTASVIDGVELVVTVDTAVAHLAGAMGKSMWLILGGFQDCKWGTGKTTGWYPGTRIFRNKGFGFDGVVNEISDALAVAA